LLPLYLAGEASPDTRALVDEYLAGDPELAQQVHAQQADEATAATGGDEIIPDLEVRSLQRTRRVLALQRWLFGLAWFFTATGLSVRMSIEGGRIHNFHLLVAEFPFPLGVVLVAAVCCWSAYFVLRQRSSAVAG
jgi:anti-sigma factor RsiW